MRRRSSDRLLARGAARRLASILLTACATAGCTGLDILLPGAYTETVSGDWIAVRFTAPRYPDDPADHAGGIDADLVTLIRGAEESVDVAAYQLDLESVADALVRAQREGVRVRLVTDGTTAGEEAVARLRQAAVPVAARPDQGWGIMHDKFVVVDGKWVWTGSWNLTENGTYRNNNNAVLVASRALALDYTAEFEELLSGLFGPSSPADTPYPLIDIEGQERAVRLEVYFAPEDGVADALLRVLSSARSSVRFMAYYFTSSRIADTLIDLAGQGVSVQGVVEARAVSGTSSQVDRLRAGGVEVLADGNPYVMHHKVFIVDDRVVVTGSYNFTASADEDNDENVLIIHDPQVATAFLAEFGRVLQEAQTAGNQGRGATFAAERLEADRGGPRSLRVDLAAALQVWAARARRTSRTKCPLLESFPFPAFLW